MTPHPINTEAFLWLDRLDDAVKHRAYDCACQVGGVDAMSIDTDWLRHALSEIRRAHRNMSERVGVAEHRATRAEAQSAIRGRAVVIYRERAKDAEGWAALWKETARHHIEGERFADAHIDKWRRWGERLHETHMAEVRDREARIKAWAQQYDYDMGQEVSRAEEAETRIKAVRDVLQAAEDRGPVSRAFDGTPFPAFVSSEAIRRALDGDA